MVSRCVILEIVALCLAMRRFQVFQKDIEEYPPCVFSLKSRLETVVPMSRYSILPHMKLSRYVP